MNKVIELNEKYKQKYYCGSSVLEMQKNFKNFNINCKTENYIDENSSNLCWSDVRKERLMISSNIIINKKTKKPLLYFIKARVPKGFEYVNSFKNTLLTILIRMIGHREIIGYLASKYCGCKVLDSNIKKGYDSLKRNTYIVRKDFYEIINGFKIRNNFSIEFSSYGEVSSMHWNIFGERINKKK